MSVSYISLSLPYPVRQLTSRKMRPPVQSGHQWCVKCFIDSKSWNSVPNVMRASVLSIVPKRWSVKSVPACVDFALKGNGINASTCFTYARKVRYLKYLSSQAERKKLLQYSNRTSALVNNFSPQSLPFPPLQRGLTTLAANHARVTFPRNKRFSRSLTCPFRSSIPEQKERLLVV